MRKLIILSDISPSTWTSPESGEGRILLSNFARPMIKALLLLSFIPWPLSLRGQQVTGVTLSQSTLVGGSNQTSKATFTLDSPMGSGGGNVSLSVSPHGVLVPFTDFVFVAAGGTSGSFTLNTDGEVSTSTAYTVTCYARSGGGANASLTVTPLTSTVALSPASIVGGTSQTALASFTLNAPLGPSGATASLLVTPNGAAVPYSDFIYIGPGAISGSFVISTSGSVATPQVYSVLIYITFSGNGTPAALTVLPATPPPSPSPPDLGSCASCLCCASRPINLTNGNVWIQQSDYTLPGLGGGLEVVRTWNSHWQDVAPVSLLGMFGHSWRSVYDERFSFPNSNTIMYWRADGSALTFNYNSGPGNYTVVSPPNEYATIVYNSTTQQYTMTMADGNERVFNYLGYLTALVDRNGNQTTLTYDTSDRVTTVTDAAARSITFAYNDPVHSTLATTATDTTSGPFVFATYVYDSSGHLTQVTYAANGSQTRVVNFNYNLDMISSVVDNANGSATVIEAHTYDAAHNGLTGSLANDGSGNAVEKVTVPSYSAFGVTQLSDSISGDSATTYGYQTIGGRNFVNSVNGSGCSSCGGRGNQWRQYDALGNILSSTDALGNTTSFTYDANGNVLTKSMQLDGSNTFTWTYTYNSFQEVLTAQDPLGKTTTNTYDAKGNLLTTTTPSPDGTLPGSVTTFTYDAKGELTQVIDPLGNLTTITYTTAGLIASIKDAQGNKTSFTYDPRGNRLTSKDALGNTTSFTYDVMNRLTQITNPDNSTTQFGYDTRGRRTSVTDGNGKVTSYGYDDADRLTSVKDAANNTTTYAYDTESRLTSITDAMSPGRTTSFNYDSFGRVTTVTFPAGSRVQESYNYDAVGNLHTKTDRNGKTITYNYDNLYRLASKVYPDSSSVTYSYDALDRLTQAVDANGTYGFTYDNMGRLTNTNTQYSFLTRALTASYSYDAASNRTSMTDPESGVTNYVYDTLNRLTTLTPPAAVTGGNFGFTYDQLSRRTQMTRPNPMVSTYFYDTLSRLTAIFHKSGSSLVDGVTGRGYDQAGNLIAQSNYLNGTQSAFAYDSIYELQKALEGAGTQESYTYDAVGNRLTSLADGYSYDASNHLTSDAAGNSYTYDANGNTLTKTNTSGTTTYNWDFENRLTSVTLPASGGTVSFKYDPFGRRIQKVSSAGTTNFAYDGDGIMEELDSTGTSVARYAQGLGIDEPLAMLRAGATSYYEADGLGSVTSLSNSAGALTNTYVYDSFGNVTSSTGSVTNPYRYTAREFDSETGLYYYRARYYDPAVGRFLSEDPASFDSGVNFYSYVSNNPVVQVDPTGLEQGPAVYDPSKWNDPGHQVSNNCYSYACNLLYPPANPHDPTTWTKPQPGQRSGRPFSSITCNAIKAAAKRDGLRDASSGGCCGKGYHKVELFVGSEVPPGPGGRPDYHWYRQDSNGKWSSKHGWLPVGPQITDPKRDAQSWGYDTDCGLMCAPNNW